MEPEYRFTRVTPSAANIAEHIALLKICFPDSTIFSPEYLRWLYGENPAGDVVGFDAWLGDALAATYVTIPAKFVVFGEPVIGLLSLNTATHPDHRGKRLFPRLADATIGAAKESGFEFIYGVANANSIGGFVKKLEFQDVIGLSARVGLGVAKPKMDVQPEDVDFHRHWDADSLAWRIRNPANPLSLTEGKDGWTASGPSTKAGIRATAFLPSTLVEGDINESGSSGISPLAVTLSTVPKGPYRGLNRELPQKLRPSPLRLIYRDLTGQRRTLDSARVHLTMLAFDAF